MTDASGPAPFQLFAGHVALDFANTLDYRHDPARAVELLPTYERVLAFCEQTGVITTAQARRLVRTTGRAVGERACAVAVALREALFDLSSAALRGVEPSAASMRALDDALAEAAAGQPLVWEHGQLVRRAPDLAARPTAPLWPIAEAAVRLLTSPDRAHIRECGSETCRWLFLDQSRNHSRRWCDMKTCGNRVKARRYHARQRRAAAPASARRPAS